MPSASPSQHFSIIQPGLGAPLSWNPAVGTKELEQLIDAYMPGPASAQEKRAAIAVDFFAHSRLTGESFKYYPVDVPAAASSRASSAPNVSPALSDMSHHSSPSQASAASARPTNKTRVASRKSASKHAATSTAFSHLPGMKILTVDGEDVTNSASRGCKTKEQRDHAHLMRILKACDACKKKKIRCDPSHKKRTTSQAESCRAEASQPAKKARKNASSPTSQTSTSTSPLETSLQTDSSSAQFSLESLASLDDSWEQYLQFDDDFVYSSIPDDFYNASPQGFDFYFGTENHFSPTNSGSTVSPVQPLTPVNPASFVHTDFTFNNDSSVSFLPTGIEQSNLPYLSSGAHGADYVDFNLYSPASSFIDEEPQKLRAGHKRKASVLQTETSNGQSPHTVSIDADWHGTTSEQSYLTGLFGDQQYCFDRSQPSTAISYGDKPNAPGTQQQFGGGSGGGLTASFGNANGRSRGLVTMGGTRLPGSHPQHISSMISPHDTEVTLQASQQESGISSTHSAARTWPLLSRIAQPQTVVRPNVDPAVAEARANTQAIATIGPQVLNSSRLRTTGPNTTNTALLSSASARIASSEVSTGEGSATSRLDGGQAQLSTGVLHGRRSASNVAVGRIAISGSASRSRSACAQSNERRVIAATARHICPYGLGLGLPQRQVLCDGPVAPSSSPQLPSAVLPTISPVRQLLGFVSKPVVLGLVSILLLVMMMTMGIASHVQPSVLLHYLPSSSMILLSLLPTLSVKERRGVCSSDSHARKPSSLLDGAGSSVPSSGGCLGRWPGVARVVLSHLDG